MRVRAGCATIVAVVALALAGCGGASDPNSRVASLGSGNNASSQTTSPSSGTHLTMAQAARKFAQCMRQHGVDMPDPKVSSDGGMVQMQIGTRGGAATPTDKRRMDAAQKACQHWMTAAGPNGGKRPDAAQQQQMRADALAFARCMRQHGVDMPDPVFGADGSVRQEGPRIASKDDKAFRDASNACAKKNGRKFGISTGGSGGAGLSSSSDS